MTVEQFHHLFEPISINQVTVPNRIVSSAHGTLLGLTDRLIDYHVERARNGVGLIILEASRVHPTAVWHPDQLLGYDPAVVPFYRRLTDALHAHGTVVFSQILHPGRQLQSVDRLPSWAPSPIPCPITKEVPHEMTRREIREVVDGHAATASNLKRAGVDGIEIHAAHGYLIQEFMSPYSNMRDDEYGGSLQNRLRLAWEIIDAVREAVGPDYPVGMRISGDEFVPGGLDLEAMQVIAPMLVARGLDFLSVSVSTYNGHSYATMIPDMHFQQGAFVYVAAAIRGALRKAGLTVPVMTVGRIIDPVHAERILAEGQADMVIMTRALLADPALPRKAREGRLADIRPCIGCNQGCVGSVHLGRPIRCLVNPVAGRESRWGDREVVPPEQRKRVLVVGGGPAGLEAARVAAERGHEVELWERQGSLGGQLAVAALAGHRGEFGRLIDWLVRQVDRHGVTVRLNTEATPDAVRAAGFDVVVLATGSIPVVPSIPGQGDVTILDVASALRDPAQVGRQVVVMDHDRHFKAAGIAEWLADSGHDVTIVTQGGETGADVPTVSFAGLRVRLGQKGVRTLSYHDVIRIDGRAVVVADEFSGREEILPDVDTLIYAGPNRAEVSLLPDLEPIVSELHLAGDCVAPRRALEAMRDGHAAGRAVGTGPVRMEL